MKFEMKMPDLATTDSAVKVLNWLVGIGSPVRRGQAVIEVETDKAAMEVEATVNGTLVEKKCEPSAQVGVGDVIAIIEIEDAREDASSPVPKVAPAVQVENMPTPAPPPAPKKSESMFARNRAVRKPPA
jgi:pyruvate/2-oxoglutarate dehydrogenase complex dihydrolipoamide acyltransferase (E2) component